MICIYKWTNLITGRVLVGQTVNSKRRKDEHLYKLKRNQHSNTHFQRSWNKYGRENFLFEIIQEVKDIQLLTPLEQQYINFYRGRDGVYNQLGPADNPRRGLPLTEEHKAKISIANKGKVRSEQARRNISRAHQGKKRSPRTLEHTANLSRARTGKKIKAHSEESKRLRSIAMIQYHKDAKGFSRDPRDGKYIARITRFKKRIILGYFDSEHEAREAYLKAKELLDKELLQ